MLTFEVLLVGGDLTDSAVGSAFPSPPVETTAVPGWAAALERVRGGDPNCVVCTSPPSDPDGAEPWSEIRAHDPRLPIVVYGDADQSAEKTGDRDAEVAARIPRGDRDRLVERAIEAARRNHVAGTLEVSDPTAANFELSELAMDEAPVGITVADANEPDEPLIYVNEAFERLTGYDEYEILGRNCRFLQGDGTDPETVTALRQAVDDGRSISVEVLNYRKNGEPFWNQLNIAPVRNDHGDVTHYLGFQSDVTERKEVELRARRQAEELRADRRARNRLLTRLDGLVRHVTAATVDSTSRSELESRVCAAIAETNDYSAAWIGTRQLTSDRLVAGQQAGCGAADEISVPVDGGGPAAEAMETGTVMTAAVESLAADSSHRRFLPPGGGVVAVPLRYRDADYGVLIVYTDTFRTVDDHEVAVFDALGRVVGTGLNALQNQRLLATDEYLELSFTGTPPGPTLVELAAEAGCELSYRGVVSRNDGRFVLSVAVDDCDVGTIEAAAGTLPDPPAVRPIASYEDGCLVEVVPPSDSFVRTVLDHNGSVRSLVADGDGAEIRIELPGAADPAAVVAALLDRYEGLSFVSQQRRERDRQPRVDFVESIQQALTDRQLETVRRAYLNDYFEWPRPVSGEEIADSMGITRSTFHQHLRAAQSKILDELLEGVVPAVHPD